MSPSRNAVSEDAIQLTLRNGAKAEAKLPANVRVVWLTVAQPSEIKEGSYVGTAAVPQADGTLKALEMQVFPPSMRGVGEGSRDWDLGAGSSMTNGSRCRLENSTTARYIAIDIISPWAKLTTRTTPKMTDSPSAIRP